MRIEGVDVIAIENWQSLETCGEMGRDENRIILTRARRVERLAAYVPAGHCYAVKADNVKEQVTEVLDHFNVVRSKEYLFSRCIKCNSNQFATLTPQDLKEAKLTKDGKWKAQVVLDDVIAVQEKFYGCQGCGHVYWEGSHWTRVQSRQQQ